MNAMGEQSTYAAPHILEAAWLVVLSIESKTQVDWKVSGTSYFQGCQSSNTPVSNGASNKNMLGIQATDGEEETRSKKEYANRFR
jgi:hypothetical protein